MNIIVDNFKIMLLYLYGFFVIYMPRFSDLYLGIPVELFSVLLMSIMIFPRFLSILKFRNTKYINKDIYLLICGISISGIYFATRAAITGNELRLAQNYFIIIQILHCLNMVRLLKQLGYDKDRMFRYIFNIAMIQGFICISMIIIPSFRQLALDLYYMGREENIFISKSRIYGLSGDYTFFTPCFHGMIGAIVTIFAIVKDKKYLIYLPFIIISILLNGRTGLIIYVAGCLGAMFFMIIKGRSVFKIFFYIMTSVFILWGGISLIKVVAPDTVKFIESGIKETMALISNRELEGHYLYLFDKMLYFPEGWSLVFGEGHRVYGVFGRSKGYQASDIGYVNDMFMGGYIYILILYGSILRFINIRVYQLGNTVKSNRIIDQLIPIILIITLSISNYKGESMRGGIILTGALLVKIILIDKFNN